MSLMDLTWDLADYPNISFSKLIVRSFKHSFFQKKYLQKVSFGVKFRGFIIL